MTADGPDHRPAKPLDKAYLRRAALAYLQRHASSVENLRRVLDRKARRRLAPDAPVPEDLAAMIDAVVAEAQRLELVDDRRFAEARVATLLRRGTSRRGLQARLAAKGIKRDVAQEAIVEAEPDEAASARRLAQRRRLGPWRVPPDQSRRDRDIAVLLRAGFSGAVARAVVEGSTEPDP